MDTEDHLQLVVYYCIFLRLDITVLSPFKDKGNLLSINP